jgi:hypothetical protein
MASFDATLCRVIVNVPAIRTAIGSDKTGFLFRSLDQIQWTAVRGAQGVPVTATAADLSDYEFTPDAVNYYGVNFTGGGNATDSITPALPGDTPWLKNLRYPFLNMAVKLSDAGDITRPATGTTFQPLSRSYPVAVSTVRGARQYTLTVETDSDADTARLAGLLSTGDVLLLQVPADYAVPVLGGYYTSQDTGETRNGVPWAMRWTGLTLTEVAVPGADVVPITSTWETVTGGYATWTDLAAALTAWADVAALVGSPADVVVI